MWNCPSHPVEVRVPVKAGKDAHETHSTLMDPSGEPAKPQPGDL